MYQIRNEDRERVSRVREVGREGELKSSALAFVDNNIQAYCTLLLPLDNTRATLVFVFAEISADVFACPQLFDLRKKLVDSNTKIGRLEFQISQLEGSQFPGHTREQAKRLQTIKSLDDDHVRVCVEGL